MISIEKLIQALGHLHEKPLVLPNNDKITQKTAIDLRHQELLQERSNHSNSQINNSIKAVIDYTMNQDFMKKDKKTIPSMLDVEAEVVPQFNSMKSLKPKSSIVYTDNEVMNVPDCLTNAFKCDGYNLAMWYVYGLKNPNSFFKTIQMLHNPEFILKSNTDKVNLTSMFKREIAIQLDVLYKQHKYHKWNFNKLDMRNQLLNEGVINYALIVATIDYIRKNVCIFDIHNFKFQYFQCASVNLDTFYMIIKDGFTFLPVMTSYGMHDISSKVLEYITIHFETSSMIEEGSLFKLRVIESGVSVDVDVDIKLESIIVEKSKDTVEDYIIPSQDIKIQPKIESKVESKEKYVESKLTLSKLQELCKTRGIDIQKEGKTGKMIMKLKKELCDELNAHDF